MKRSILSAVMAITMSCMMISACGSSGSTKTTTGASAAPVSTTASAVTTAAAAAAAAATTKAEASTTKAEASTTKANNDGKQLTFAIVYANIHPFFDAIGKGAEQKVKDMGINAKVITEGPQNGNVSQQI